MGYEANVAVMARRREPADSLDFFPTPPWSTRSFCEHVMPKVWPWPDVFAGAACDPACGQGHMALALAEYFGETQAADIFDYGFGCTADFLDPSWSGLDWRPDWIVTNPPFNKAASFITMALARARRGVAVLARTQFVEGQERYRLLFEHRPPQLVAQHVERVPMHRGRWVVRGKSATAYQWLVWLKHPPHDWRHTRFVWIPKSRVSLTRADDWLRFGGCEDIPAGHPALAPAGEPGAAALADVKSELERLLL